MQFHQHVSLNCRIFSVDTRILRKCCNFYYTQLSDLVKSRRDLKSSDHRNEKVNIRVKTSKEWSLNYICSDCKPLDSLTLISQTKSTQCDLHFLAFLLPYTFFTLIEGRDEEIPEDDEFMNEHKEGESLRERWWFSRNNGRLSCLLRVDKMFVIFLNSSNNLWCYLKTLKTWNHSVKSRIFVPNSFLCSNTPWGHEGVRRGVKWFNSTDDYRSMFEQRLEQRNFRSSLTVYAATLVTHKRFKSVKVSTGGT